MTAPPPDTMAQVTASRPSRRADTGAIRFSQRDIDGLMLCGEQYGAPFDLLADALRVPPQRLPAITSRWRRAGYAGTGRLGPGPGWCWLTRDGMAATGLGFPATRPALGRLAHIRAVFAARLWVQASRAWYDGRAWWHCCWPKRAQSQRCPRTPNSPWRPSETLASGWLYSAVGDQSCARIARMKVRTAG